MSTPAIHEIYIDLVGTTTATLLAFPKVRKNLVVFSERNYLARGPYRQWIVAKPRLDIAQLPPNSLPQELGRPFTKYLNAEFLWSDAWVMVRRRRYPKGDWIKLFENITKHQINANDWVVKARAWADEKDQYDARMHTALISLIRRQTGIVCIDLSLVTPINIQWMVQQILQVTETERRRIAKEGVALNDLTITITSDPRGETIIPPKINQHALKTNLKGNLEAKDWWGQAKEPAADEPSAMLLLANIPKHTYEEIIQQLSILIKMVLTDSPERCVHVARMKNQSDKEYFVTSLTDSPLRYILGDVLETHPDYKTLAVELTRMHILRPRENDNPELELTDPTAFAVGEPLNSSLTSIALHTDDPLLLPLAEGTWRKKNSAARSSSMLLLLNADLFDPKVQDILRKGPLETIHSTQHQS
jgi:hypothetical protein